MLDRHLQRKHPTSWQKYTKARHAMPTGPLQSSMNLFLKQNDDHHYGPKHPEQVNFTKSVVQQIIIGCGCPISIVEKSDFRDFISQLNPKLVIPSRQTISYNIIPKLAVQVQDQLSDKLSKSKYVALTIDIWTDRRMHSFLGVTFHIFRNCRAFSGLLSFKVITGSHTGVKIAEELTRIIDDNSIKEKLFFVVSDNASNMRKAFDVMQSFNYANPETSSDLSETDVDDAGEGVSDDSLWLDLNDADAAEVSYVLDSHSTERLPCFSHSLQLVVRDGLDKAASLRSLLSKCAKLANLCHQSTHFREAFEATFGVNRAVPVANSTRWSSTFTQLQSIALLKLDALPEMLRTLGHPQLIFVKKDEESLREIVEILKPFAEATTLLQGSLYATIGCVIPCVISLYRHVSDFQKTVKHHATVVKQLQSSLCARFQTLLSDLRIPVSVSGSSRSSDYGFGKAVYQLACVLDPSFAFQWLEHHHPGDAETRQQVRDKIIDLIVAEAENLRIFSNEHERSASATATVTSSAPDPSVASCSAAEAEAQADPPAFKRQRLSLFSSYDRAASNSNPTASAVSIRSLVLAYIEYATELSLTSGMKTADELWETVRNNKQFEALHTLFEKIFSAPATSAPVERVFSSSGLLMRPHRANMSDKLLSDLVFLTCNRL